MLIKYGVRITQQMRGWNALHYACAFNDDLAYVKPLLDYGADIDKRTYAGKTALSSAIVQNHPRSATFLIKNGTDLDILDNEGQSPLALSIKFSRFESMKLLLLSGATHNLLSEGDETLLYLVAKFPDVNIIEYLSDFDLGDVDLDARNKDHLTARELVQIHNSDPNTALAFQKLVARVASKMNTDVEPIPSFSAQDIWDSDSTPEIFEDTVEQ